MKWRGRTWLQGPQVPRPGPVGQVARWFETLVAFACLCLCGFETAIAFAGEKWAVLVQFSGAKVMAVSVVPCWGRAVVLLVSTSPCFCVLCAKFVALLGLMWVRARKSSSCVLTMAKSWRLMARWASIFAEMRLKRLCRASLLCRVPGSRAPLLAVLTRSCAAKPYWWHGRQPAQATTYRASVRRKRPRPPPHGLTCASKGHACAGCVHRNKRGPDGSQVSRRSPCLLGDDGGGTPKGPASRCVR